MNLALGTPGPFELIIILVVILLLFGAKRLPDLSRSLGKSLSEFKKGREEGLRGDSPAEKIGAPAKKTEAVAEKDNTEN
jgi:sec-independent protein translocase protein TatA